MKGKISTLDEYENQIITSHGEKRIIKWNNTILKENGKIIGTISSGQDVTEERKRKDELKASEERFRGLFENSFDGVIYTDMKGVIENANKNFCKMLGYTLKELIGLKFKKITPKKIYEWEWKEKVKKEIFKKGYAKPYEKQYIKKNGKIIDIELSPFLLKNNKVDPIGMWGIARDISERKKYETKLLEQKKFIRKSGKITIRHVLHAFKKWKTSKME